MKFYQLIHKIEYKSKLTRELVNIFDNVEWIYSFECPHSIYEVNRLMICPPEKFKIFKSIMNNSDHNYMNNTGLCPLYWHFDLNGDKKNYGHTLICEEYLKRLNKENYIGLFSYLRNIKIDSILE